jgi:hypothetical protein
LTGEHFYKNFSFLGLLWPQREGKRVWPAVIDDAKITYLERLEKARQFREGQIPKWEMAIANIRFSGQVAFLFFETVRAIDLIAFRKQRSSSETAKKRPHHIKSHPIPAPATVNATCNFEVRGGITTSGVVKVRLVEPPEQNTTDSTQG